MGGVFNLLGSGSIQSAAFGKCWHPLGGSAKPANENEVVLHTTCNEGRLRFIWHREPEPEPEQCGYIQHSGGKCIHPLGGSPNPPVGTKICTATGCREDRLYFCKTASGELRHKTSGLCIVSPNNPANGARLVFGHCGTNLGVFNLLGSGSIQSAAFGKCWHPLGGSGKPANENEVVLHTTCNEGRLRFIWHRV